MQRHSTVNYHKLPFTSTDNCNWTFDSCKTPSLAPPLLPSRLCSSSGVKRAAHASMLQMMHSESTSAGSSNMLRHLVINALAGESVGDPGSVDEDDYQACPVECVREFRTDEEFIRILDKAKKANSLVVVDFYRTACGSCKYIEQGFSKLCKGSGGEEAPVIFLKHNVMDEYDEQSEVAQRLRIKVVPLFHFYKGGVLVEAFATRDKVRITEAILKHSSPDA